MDTNAPAPADRKKPKTDLAFLDAEKAAALGRRYHSAEAPIGLRHAVDSFEEKGVNENYEQFYSRAGWSYDQDIECAFLHHRILQPLGIKPGASILELGCGTGFHAWLMHCLGMKVTAIDHSHAGIEQARKNDGVDYRCIDAAEFLQDKTPRFDMVLARGMAWFHYELEPGPNQYGIDVGAAMESIMEMLNPGGVFVLQIRTDFTGTYVPPVGGVRNHTWQQGRDFLGRYGEIVLYTDWHGIALPDAESALRSGANIIGAVRKKNG